MALNFSLCLIALCCWKLLWVTTFASNLIIMQINLYVFSNRTAEENTLLCPLGLRSIDFFQHVTYKTNNLCLKSISAPNISAPEIYQNTAEKQSQVFMQSSSMDLNCLGHQKEWSFMWNLFYIFKHVFAWHAKQRLLLIFFILMSVFVERYCKCRWWVWVGVYFPLKENVFF